MNNAPVPIERPEASGWYYTYFYDLNERPMLVWVNVTEYGLSWGECPNDDPEMLPDTARFDPGPQPDPYHGDYSYIGY